MEVGTSHTCGEYGSKNGPICRALCSYCAAIAVSPEKCGTAMNAVIVGEQLQLEILVLQKTGVKLPVSQMEALT